MTTAIASDRLKKRFDRWDFDGNGALERADFEKEAQHIAEAFGKDAGAAEVQTLKNAFGGLFDYLAKEAGVGSDGSLTEEQFIRVTENLIFEQGEASFNRVLGPVVKGIVGMCDKNADGQINADEFAAWLTALGMSKAEAAEAFNQVDTNGNGELSLDELLTAVRDFHFGRLDVELLG
ncbi:Ca2+-binding EF-hand superfamily protein [Saccharopolyspora erythraea NRRL 2338]|uniref:Calcium binding protein n=3 Tax=Saccharopolyspora erythraea TaxID=1836 RepID=A4FEK4_SACEN|nr:EF-hand domain-containing protein [Saccharopolyspora erythraea]EQD82838.1 Calerythrin [Saccharopolyspora erythraea D]PFG96204.1 Ca2+-binding EF-hand superfamily protein [Saccharopolyspora erythraea NRRL 2338]QRK92732.1 EF-hand domain-containing protein [Saccharopolyspora erythraea]CAM02479.1 calcium binding protein [Saccharopolyspora erythraea NRRL 2338]